MVAAVDPQTIEALTTQIVDLCADIHRAEYRLLTLIRRLDALQGWNAEMPSCAHWLNATCGLDLVTAREKVRVAHALENLPVVDEAFKDGRLSYSKVRAVTRVATPANQTELVQYATSTTAAHVEQYVRAQRQAERLADSRAALDAYRHRSFTCHTADDGSLVFEGRLPAEQGAMLRLALERGMEWVYREAAPQVREAATAHHHAERRRARCRRGEEQAFKDVPYSARQADALAALAERFLASPPTMEESLSTADRYQVVVHASAESLVEHGLVDPADAPRMEDGPTVAQETVRRITCDSAIVRLLETGAGEPLDVGRKTRVITPALRRAVKRRDGHCRWPGCTNSRHWEGHHCQHWADGGATNLKNVISVCRFHHRLLHEGGYFVVKDGDEFVFCRPDGSMIPPADESLHRSIARAQRDLTIVRLGGAVEEQRAVYRTVSQIPHARREGIIGELLDIEVQEVAVGTVGFEGGNSAFALQASEDIGTLDQHEHGRRDRATGNDRFRPPASFTCVDQSCDHHRGIDDIRHLRSASRAETIAAAPTRVPAASLRSRTERSQLSNDGLLAMRSCSPRRYSSMDLRCRAAREASSSRTSSGTSRIVICTPMKAYGCY